MPNTQVDIQFENIIDNGTADGTFSIVHREYIVVNNKKVYVTDPKRLGVAPGDFDKVEAFAPELLDTFKAIWTPYVIAAWQKKLLLIEKQEREVVSAAEDRLIQ